MSAELILKDLKNKVYKPIYLLMGEEPFYIDQITDYIANNVLDDGEKEFNQTILYGKDSDPQTIIDAARRYPMMAERQVIIVKEAQHIKGFESAFEAYFENPVETTILVFNYKYKNLDKRKKAIKNAQKNGVLFQSDKLKEYKVGEWIQKHVHSKKLKITDKASLLLIEFLGNDLSKISNEVGKLSIVLKPGDTIDDKIIEENIGISKDYNLFELTNALGELDRFKAQKIVQYFAQNPKAAHITMLVSGMFSFFTKLMLIHFAPQKDQQSIASLLKIHPYAAKLMIVTAKKFPPSKIAANISILREYDLKSKGYNRASTTDGELLKEMVYKLMH